MRWPHGPGFRRRQVGAGEGIGAHHLRGLGGFGVTGRIDQRNGGRAGFAEVGIAGGGFAVQRQVQDLAYGLVRILGRGEALAVANREEQRLAVGREGDCPAFLAAFALGHLVPQHLESSPLQRGGVGGEGQLGARQRQTAAVVTRFGIREIDSLVGSVTSGET